ncbi:MAG: ATP-binding protein [Thermodesulfobacteriota bacterium]|nr:ATP-binding protein [Thermodesulfobacteriota bacterium]
MALNFQRKIKENFAIKSFVIFTILLFIISCSFTTFFIYQQKKIMKKNLIKKGILLSEIFAHNSRIAVFSENEDMLAEPIGGILQQKEVLDVSVFNSEGKLLKEQKNLGIDVIKEIIKTDREDRIRIFNKLKRSMSPFLYEGEHRLEFWAPVIAGTGYEIEDSLFFGEDLFQKKDRVIGFVRIALDKEMLIRQVKDLLIKSILLGTVFWMGGSGITYLVVRGITKPLNRLTKGVKTLGEGGVVEKVDVESEDEIGRLAMAFNDMSESLKMREMEKEQLEEQLRHTQKMEAIGTLAGGISHDFNNILACIMGYTELALSDLYDENTHRRYLNEVLKASKRATDLVKQILTFSHQGKQERKPIQLSFLVKETLRMMRASLPTTIEIRQNIKTGLGPILANPTQIHQVLVNLCTNASHAMREKGGVLEISLEDVDVNLDISPQYNNLMPGQYQRLIIRDTGCGMNNAIMEKIFIPYFTTKKPSEGTGMGLAMVHGIIKGHDGEISVNSTPGKGTTFQILLPTIEDKITTEQEYFIAPPRGESERILFVDDEKGLVDIGLQMLKGLGYKVVGRTSSIEALELFRVQADRFDLVITDQTMPNMTGGDMAIEMIRIRPDIPIILCTGFSEVISEAKAKAIGIRKFIMKPLVKAEMAGIIKEVLDNRKLEVLDNERGSESIEQHSVD